MMKVNLILPASAAILIILFLAACASPLTVAPTPAPTATHFPTPSSSQGAPPKVVSNDPTPAGAAVAFETRHNAGGGVTVDVKPTRLVPGESASFDIALNTHSVDLGDDMVKITILRDDTGLEYRPTTWEGDSPGGHHRSGTLNFGALTGKPQYVQLVVKGLAQVPERSFKWELP